MFVDRTRELARLAQFWQSGRAECIPVIGRRRVGKTLLLEHFAEGKSHVYYRCRLAHTDEQLPLLGKALALASDDSVVRAQPPSTWEAIFALIERYSQQGRFLLVLDELPYWVAKHDQVPSVLQNWWDQRGRHLNLMLIICGSAVQMMERLLSGEAPLAGCPTGRLPVRPLTFWEAAELLQFPTPADTLAAYGILGGVPLYLSLFDAKASLRDNIAKQIVSPSARLYVEPYAVFAAHHQTFQRDDAMRVLAAIAGGAHQWSDIVARSRVPATSLQRLLDVLIGDLSLVQRYLPVTAGAETKAVRTQYRLTDNFFRFWFTFVEPASGRIEFGGEQEVADAILGRLPDYLGEPFEEMCREWTREVGHSLGLGVDVNRVGSWWTPNHRHQLDVVALDARGRVVLTGECKWQNSGFSADDLERYLGHVRALDREIRPEARHLLFSKTSFGPSVVDWANVVQARLVTPEQLLRSNPP